MVNRPSANENVAQRFGPGRAGVVPLLLRALLLSMAGLSPASPANANSPSGQCPTVEVLRDQTPVYPESSVFVPPTRTVRRGNTFPVRAAAGQWVEAVMPDGTAGWLIRQETRLRRPGATWKSGDCSSITSASLEALAALGPGLALNAIGLALSWQSARWYFGDLDAPSIGGGNGIGALSRLVVLAGGATALLFSPIVATRSTCAVGDRLEPGGNFNTTLVVCEVGSLIGLLAANTLSDVPVLDRPWPQMYLLGLGAALGGAVGAVIGYDVGKSESVDRRSAHVLICPPSLGIGEAAHGPDSRGIAVNLQVVNCRF
jgi:hypothetical protein